MPTLILLFPLVLVIAAILTGRPGLFLVAVGLFVYVTWKQKTEGAARSAVVADGAGAGAGGTTAIPQFAITTDQAGRSAISVVGCECVT